MPGMRAAVSETVMSGSLPMSSATTASTIWTLLRLLFCADCNERLRPVTTISGPVSAAAAGVPCVAAASGLGGGGGGTSCANAGVANRAAASAVVENSTNELRDIAEPPFKTTTAKWFNDQGMTCLSEAYKRHWDKTNPDQVPFSRVLN